VHRLLSIVVCCMCLTAALPAGARTPVRGKVTGFDLLQVNQEVVHVKPGGSHPLCQAIPITAIRVRVSWSHARKGASLRVSLAVPGNGSRGRTIHPPAGTGSRKIEFTPVTEHLPAGAFPGGTYSAALRAGDRTLSRATVALTQETTTC
jgi:hypothetical protein